MCAVLFPPTPPFLLIEWDLLFFFFFFPLFFESVEPDIFFRGTFFLRKFDLVSFPPRAASSPCASQRVPIPPMTASSPSSGVKKETPSPFLLQVEGPSCSSLTIDWLSQPRNSDFSPFSLSPLEIHRSKANTFFFPS